MVDTDSLGKKNGTKPMVMKIGKKVIVWILLWMMVI